MSKKYKTVSTDIVVGADGVNSLVRAFLQQGQHSQHSQMQTGWEYKQISFSPEIVKKMQLNDKRAYSSTRKQAIFVALPNKDRTFSGMLALPKAGFAKLNTEAAVKEFITDVFPELVPGLPEIIPALLKNPNGSFITMKTYPWIYKDFMVLVGDASHSVTPFIGHGVTVGLGDCLKLVQLIDTYDGNWTKIFSEYQENRKKNADTLVDMSLESFSIFQRERKADFRIIYAALESLLHRLFPRLLASSTFEQIVFDPDSAADYMETNRKQRGNLRLIGMPFFVRVLTFSILCVEIMQQYFKPFIEKKSEKQAQKNISLGRPLSQTIS